MWLEGLNPEQREAVLHTQGPLLILAGAGSGKTTVLVSRTGRLLTEKQARADQVAVLTFTTKAARELKHRVSHKIGPRAKDLWTGTFHSFGLQILRKNTKLAGLPDRFGVIDQSDSQSILKELLGSIKNTAKDSFKVETLASMINSWREKGQTRAQNEDEYEIMSEVLLPKYLKRLEALGVSDFEGLLLKPLELFQNHPQVLQRVQEQFRFVMVDEFQDTNNSQFRLVQELSRPHQNLAVVGDDDQAIYGWRGACVSNILEFPLRFENCRVIRLERNYRSTPAILHVANQVIAKNEKRHGKVLKAQGTSEPGEKPELFIYDSDDLETEEVVRHIQYFIDRGYSAGDIAILYRSNSQGGLLEGLLRQNRVPYVMTGGTGLFERKETKDILAYLRCALRPNEVALRRILNVPARGIGETSIERISQYANERGLSFLHSLRKWREAGVGEKIGESIEALLLRLQTLPSEILAEGSSETVGARMCKLFRQIGYRDYLRTLSKEDATTEKRWQVVEIIGRILDAFVLKGGSNEKTLQDFVDSLELRDAEDALEDDIPKVQLLTLHACKGLEFPAVILMGIEEDLLPHRVLGQDVTEERRLFYVGITRAKERLIMTRARQRKRYGRLQLASPSRFLSEIAADSICVYESGYRPVGADERAAMIRKLMGQIDQNIQAQKIEV